MLVSTTRFGEIEVVEDSIIKIPKGLIGFESVKEFCVIQDRPDTPFKWLQSMRKPELAFVVVDPSQFFADYEIEISDEDAEFLGIEDAEDAVVMTIVTISKEKEITANLLGPVVVNARTLVGMQVVLQDERYGTKHSIGTLAGEEQSQRPVQRAIAA